MSLDDIKKRTQEVNKLGAFIIKVSDLIFALPEDSKADYALQLLKMIKSYYQDIKDLNGLIDEYKKEESEKNLPVSLSIHRLQKDLEKFSL